MALPQDRPVRGGGQLSAYPDWLWIPLTITAAIALALRTAAQKWLAGRLSAGAATYVRYLFALPIVAAYGVVAVTLFDVTLPVPGATAVLASALVAAGQIGGTWFLLKALESRNFAVGVAYSKTDVLQAALFEAVVLGAAVTWGGAAAMALATAGVMVISVRPAGRRAGALLGAALEPAAAWGLASGASFAVAGVSVRAAVLDMEQGGLAGAALVALLIVLTLQTLGMGAYLAWRDPAVFARIARFWRVPLFAGACGALSSICWFLALGLQKAAYVRTLGLVEIVATVAISRLVFGERIRAAEIAGIALLLTGIALLLNSG